LRKTEVLLTVMRKHQIQFKSGLKHRVALWTKISKELSRKGFTNCDRDECCKKWDNLFRTFKKVHFRDGKNATWELYKTVMDLVKCLNWPHTNSKGSKNKLFPPSENFETTDEELSIKLLEKYVEHSTEQYKKVEACSESFRSKVAKLESEREVLLKRIEKMLGNDGKTALTVLEETTSDYLIEQATWSFSTVFS
jgi:hypothetical protein